MPYVKRHQGVGSAVDSRFQHHFIARITKLGPPEKMCRHWLGQCHDRRKKDLNLTIRQPCGLTVLRPATDSFVF
jgi:hypothetical protein